MSRQENMFEDDFIQIAATVGVFASDQKVWIRNEGVWDRQVLCDCVYVGNLAAMAELLP
jgi:hypothetical protein